MKRFTFAVVFFVLFVVTSAVGVLHTEWAEQKIQNLVEQEIAALLPGTELRIGNLEGPFLTGLSVTNLALFVDDSLVVSIDSARVDYSLVGFLFGRIDLSDVTLVRPRIIARQHADSTWDVLSVLPKPDTTAARGEPLEIAVDRGRIIDGEVLVRFSIPKDSSVTLNGIEIYVEYFETGTDVRFDIPIFSSRLTADGLEQPITISGGAVFDDGRFACSGCQFSAAGSNVSIDGYVEIGDRALRGANLDVRLDSLSFADLNPFLPMLQDDQVISGSIHIVGPADSVAVTADLISRSGSLTFSGLAVRRDSVIYEASGSIDRLDPAKFWRDAPIQGTLNASVEVSLSGHSLDSADGRASLTIVDSKLNGRKLARSDIQLVFAGGKAKVSAHVVLPAVTLQLAGDIEPFAHDVRYDLSGNVEGRGIEHAYTKLQDLGDLKLVFAVSGNTGSVASLVEQASVHVEALTYDGFLFQNLALSAHRLTDWTKVTVSGQVRSAKTNALIVTTHLNASLRLDETIEVRVDSVHFSDLDAGLGSDPNQPLTNMSGSIKAGGVIDKGTLYDAHAVIELSGSAWGIPIDSLFVRVSSVDDRVDFDVEASSSNSHASARGQVWPFKTGFPVAIERGRFNDVDLAVLLDNPSFYSALNGDFRFRSNWVSSSSHNVSLQLDLDTSNVVKQRFEGGGMHAVSVNGKLAFSLNLPWENGGVTATGNAEIYDGLSNLWLETARISGLDVGKFADIPGLVTSLNGSLRINSVENLQFANLSLEPSSVNGEPIERGEISFLTMDGKTTIAADIGLSVGRIRLDASLESTQEGTDLVAVLLTDSLNILRVMGIDSVDSSINLRCEINGAFFPAEDRNLAAACFAGDSHLGAARIDSFRLGAHATAAEIQIDTVGLVSNVAMISGSGIVLLAAQPDTGQMASEQQFSNFDVSIDLLDLSPLEEILGVRLLHGEGTIEASARGRRGSLKLSIEPHLGFLTYNGHRVSSIDGFVQLDEFGNDGSPRVEAVIDVGFSVLDGTGFQAASISLVAEDSVITMSADVTLDSRRRGSVFATWFTDDERPKLVIDDLALNLDGARWSLTNKASIIFGDKWEIDQFQLYQGEGQIALDGYVSPNGQQNLIVTAEQVPVGDFVDLLGYQDIDGNLEGHLILGGRADDLIVEASFRIQDLTSQGILAGTLQLDANYAAGNLRIEGSMRHVSAHTASITGMIPILLSMTESSRVFTDQAFSFKIVADSLPLDWANSLIHEDAISEIGGVLGAEIVAAGTWENPQLQGSGSIEHGRVKLPDLSIELSELQAQFTLHDNLVEFSNISAVSGSGQFTGSGNVGFESLDDLDLDLDVSFDNFSAISTGTYRLNVSGTAELTGSMRAPVVVADLEIGPADVFLTEELLAEEIEPIVLDDRDLRILERRFGYRITVQDTSTFDFIKAMTLNATASIKRDVWLRSRSNPVMDIEFSGDVSITQQPGSEQQLFGTIDVNPTRSRIVTFARRFGVEKGTITFNGLVEDAVVDFTAEYVVPSRFGGDEVKILLGVSGVMDNLELEMNSEPQMDDATVVSYLLTGRPPDEASISGEQAAEIAIGGVSRLVEAFANENFGLDVVEINASGTEGTTLTVGKYLSPKTYVSVTQPLSESISEQNSEGRLNTEMAIEYELFPWLISEFGSKGNDLRFNLRWQFSF